MSNPKIGEISSKLMQHIARANRSFMSIFDQRYFLLLLSTTRDGLFESLDMTDDGKLKSDVLFRLKNSGKYSSIMSFFDRFFTSIESEALKDIIIEIRNILSEIESSTYPQIFDDILYSLSSIEGRNSGNYILPQELSRLMMSVAGSSSKTLVYNPFAGVASFSTFLDPDQQYYGQENNVETFVLGVLRLYAYGINSDNYKLEDSINNWNSFHKKFDLIISAPPIGMWLNDEISGNFGSIRNAIHFTIEKGLQDLSSTGTLVIMVKDVFLTSQGVEKNLRKYLIEQDLLETVISLPSGILPNAAVKTSILIIRRVKRNPLKINFVEADSFIKRGQTNELILDDRLLTEVMIREVQTKFYQTATIQEVIETDYRLDSKIYLFDKNFLKGKHLRRIEEFAILLRGLPVSEGVGKIVKVKDLKSDPFDYNLQLDSIPTALINRRYRKISEECLLLSIIGISLKPTLFRFSGTPIMIEDSIIALKLEISNIEIEYIIHELSSDSVIAQIQRDQIGSIVPRLTTRNVLSLFINMPSLLEQKSKVEGIKQAYIQIKKRELLLQQELLGIKEDVWRDFASMKHTFRQYLNALKSNVVGTKYFIENNTGREIYLNSIYSSNLNKTFGEHLIGVENTIDSMSRILNAFESEVNTDEVQNFSLEDLIGEAQNRFKNLERFEFEPLFFDEDSFTLGDDSIFAPMVSIVDEDFYRLFSNIVSNAIDHGFKDPLTKYNIRTALRFDENQRMVVLEISNNGVPIPSNYTIKNLVTRGDKTSDSFGTGVGGADIKDIMKKYNGELDLINDSGSNFPVTYVLKFPLFTVTL